MERYQVCYSVEGPGARWARSPLLHALTIGITTNENAEKVLKGSNYDGMAGSAPILNGRLNYIQTES